MDGMDWMALFFSLPLTAYYLILLSYPAKLPCLTGHPTAPARESTPLQLLLQEPASRT